MITRPGVRRKAWAVAAACWAVVVPCGPALADREPVLKQVDLPHSYYWRGLYLPQLTSGPSSAAFVPDGTAVVYAMEGSLWRQPLDSGVATELTHPRGAYDYQPDVAPDGRSVVYARYDGASVELLRLDLASGREQALTRGGDVNVEPRLSPDGRRLAWVSTRGTGHFNLYVADVGPGGLSGARPLVEPRQSAIDRYYYSTWNHAVNPSWAPDGRTVYYVSNPEVPWGSGDLWAVSATDPTAMRRVLREETTWSAHPEPAPSGPRLLYSSYRGRQWHQLWLTTTDGAAPLPLTFGEFDARNARWSPDGARILYVGNPGGNTSLVVHDVVGGAERTITARERRYLVPRGRLTIDVRDASGRAVPARVGVVASDGRAYATRDAWMHADDGFDRARMPQEVHYFHCAPPCELEVPAGTAHVTVTRGLESLPWVGEVQVEAGGSAMATATLVPHALPDAYGRWVSADLHVHMNYGGDYRNTPERLVAQARAEDLDIVYNLVVNKEERVPDVGYFRAGTDPASTGDVLLLEAQEFHTSFWGHLGLLNLGDHLITPDYAAYRHTAIASPYPTNAVVADLAHAQGGLAGYVHPYDFPVVPEKEKSLSNALPADVIGHKVDYVEIVGFSDHKATAEVWYRLLNLGFRLPAGAGTDAMANYASLRGPIGLNRVYLATNGRLDAAAARDALVAGRTFATNSALLGFEVGGVAPGAKLTPGRAGARHYTVSMRSPVAMDHLEIVQNGQVLKVLELSGDRRSYDGEGDLDLAADGWIVLRAWNDHADPQVLDIYPYATTSPLYVEGFGPHPDARDDARYFVAWMDRVIEATRARTSDFNDERERSATFDYLEKARAGYAALASGSR
ncbi:MAG: CehA/McbA family metallohydrolase [Steroidobacteraceae bacterium]